MLLLEEKVQNLKLLNDELLMGLIFGLAPELYLLVSLYYPVTNLYAV